MNNYIYHHRMIHGLCGLKDKFLLVVIIQSLIALVPVEQIRYNFSSFDKNKLFCYILNNQLIFVLYNRVSIFLLPIKRLNYKLVKLLQSFCLNSNIHDISHINYVYNNRSHVYNIISHIVSSSSHIFYSFILQSIIIEKSPILSYTWFVYIIK